MACQPIAESSSEDKALPTISRKKWLFFAGVCCIGVFVGLFIFLASTVLLHCKSQYQFAETFDLTKLERANLAQDRVPFDQVSSHFVNALISAEDPRFFEHQGVDYGAIYQALTKKGSRGASTITGNLIRLSFKDELSRRSPASAIFLAHRVERELDKKQILELYMNRIYFGNGYNGIGAVARGYFEKTPKALNVAESATLASVIRNPYYRSPRLFPESSKKSRDYVLSRMRELGFIDINTMKLAQNSPIGVN